MNKRDTVLVVLSCLHTVLFTQPAPRLGETVWCRKCAEYREAAQAPAAWHVKCISCRRLDGDYGQAEITADTAAIKHASRFAGHCVVVTNGDVEVKRIRHEVIPMSNVPPF